jgi:hypothetical protein
VTHAHDFSEHHVDIAYGRNLISIKVWWILISSLSWKATRSLPVIIEEEARRHCGTKRGIFYLQRLWPSSN